VAPMEYLLAWRMQFAQQWLRQGELRASEIAERVGYGSSSAFSAAFRRYAGVAPSRYSPGTRFKQAGSECLLHDWPMRWPLRGARPCIVR
jgi:AraC-like DNA-binding protein